jgi:hypothetical protein
MGDDRGAGGTSDATGTPREREATSDETLDDLENTQSDATTKTTGGASGESSRTETATPSPDGAFDSPRGGRADGSDAGEPM